MSQVTIDDRIDLLYGKTKMRRIRVLKVKEKLTKKNKQVVTCRVWNKEFAEEEPGSKYEF